MEYTISLCFALPDNLRDHDKIMEALHKADCTDALPSLGREGFLQMEFIREAPSRQEAFDSAVLDVEHALPGAYLVTQMD